MINQIINGIAIAIHGQFPDANIYTDTIEQDLIEPAFYIHNINVDQSNLIAGRTKQSMPFEVVHFPLNGITDINTTQPVLLSYLRQITLESGQKLNGYNIKGQTIDGVLHVFADYDIVVKFIETQPESMGEIEIMGGIEDGS